MTTIATSPPGTGCTECACKKGGAGSCKSKRLEDLENLCSDPTKTAHRVIALDRSKRKERCRRPSAPTSPPMETMKLSPQVQAMDDEDGYRAVRLPKAEKRIASKIAKQRVTVYAALARVLGLEEPPQVAKGSVDVSEVPLGALTNFLELTPRRTLLVVNASSAGIGAISAGALEGVFASYGGFERVYMAIGKPYSFAIFRSGEEAARAKDALHARLCPQLRVGKALFLEFVTHRTFAQLCGIDAAQVEIEAGGSDAETNAGAAWPEGLYFYPDFISLEEEQTILAAVAEEEAVAGEQNPDGHDPKLFRVQGRNVKHYGQAFDYHLKHVSRDESLTALDQLPPWIHNVTKRLTALPSWSESPATDSTTSPDQMTVQHYPPGAGIGFHADSHTAFNDAIAILSLGTAVMMDFRHPSQSDNELGTPLGWPKGQGDPRPVASATSVDLLPRSLLIMRGPARYEWEHAIRTRRSDPAPVPLAHTVLVGAEDKDHGGVRARQDRWSLTFRTVNQSIECGCTGPLCDVDSHVVRALRAKRVSVLPTVDSSGATAAPINQPPESPSTPAHDS